MASLRWNTTAEICTWWPANEEPGGPCANSADSVICWASLAVIATEESGENHWRIHKCSSTASAVCLTGGEQLMFVSLSVHIFKEADWFPERVNL